MCFIFSCSLSNVQDIAVHWTEPRSGKDLKKSLRLGKVILVILIKSKSKAKWSWSSWSSPSDSWCHPDQVFETWEGDLDRNGAGSYHDLDDDHPQQNSQVIANRIDHHQLQYNPNAKELKMWELMLFQKKSQAEHGLKTYKPRLDLSIETQKWSDPRVWHKNHAILKSLVSVNLLRWSWRDGTWDEKSCLLRFFLRLPHMI